MAFKNYEKKKKKFNANRVKKSHLELQEIQSLKNIIENGAPEPGTNPLALDVGLETSYAAARTFEQLPISDRTKQGLQRCKFVTLTAIQRATLPHALCGRDILGAAKTGSGKTLAFIIPVLEALYRARWSRSDGLGAIILSPTRELALQIFEELRKVGAFHDFSGGLLIGGKDVNQEKLQVAGLNILICTPGRLLQHMDETPGFDANNLQILVLDEADRILDLGFSATLDAILENLPRERQTMLFSATQTKSVKDLARLSLDNPEYLAVHAEAKAPTPLKLQQAYMVIPLQDKMDVLWSFIRTHLRAKTLVFLSTCKQVRFVYEAFKRLRPGVPLRALHGGMKQMKRASVFYDFNQPGAAVMFATDIAARGLDFPSLDWVVQVDCPEDVAAYIHRVGRTARYTSAGRSLLLLTHSESENMVPALSEANIPMTRIKVNPQKTTPVTPALTALLAKNIELKEFAQRAVTAYVRSVFKQPNKKVFNVTSLPIQEFAASFGLLSTPSLRFLKKSGAGAKGPVDEDEDDYQEDIGKAKNGESADARFGRNWVVQDEAAGTTKQSLSNGVAQAAQREPVGVSKAEKASREAGQKRGVEDGQILGAEAEQKLGKKRKVESVAASNLEQATTSRRDDGAADGTRDGSGDDDFLVVKRSNVFNIDTAAASTAAAPKAETNIEKKKKRKKLKIKSGTVSGNRVVFDEDGEALDPLALLARDGFGEDGSEPGDQAGVTEEGMYVVAKEPQERFSRAAKILKERDARDKAALKELRASQRSAAKARARNAEEEQQPGRVAVLGRPSASDESEEETEEEEYSRDAREEESSSESDDDNVQPRANYTEVAHAGMRPAEKARMGTPQHLAQQHDAKVKLKREPASITNLSVAEQEQLALQMLRSKR